MKLAVVIILFFLLRVNTVCYSQQSLITLDFDRAAISNVFKWIEQQSSYKFVYANDIFPTNIPVTVHLSNVTISTAVAEILKNTGFSFKINGDLIVITAPNTAAQSETVTGRVTGFGGELLPGITVSVENKNTRTATDSRGEYSIRASANDVLVFTAVGYRPERISVPVSMIANALMTEAVQDLNEVVMVGYGERRKKDITGAVSLISGRNIEQAEALSPQISMQGMLAGVSVISGGSNPTARPVVRIRGVGTFSENGAADPLYIIDGIPLVEGGAGATVDKTNDPTRRGPVNLYTAINPNDIESITVLKDAAAAIYGVRAANGVVLITTKTGKKGPVQVDVSAVYGTQKIPKTYDVLNTQQYVKLYTDAYNANPEENNNVLIPIREASRFGRQWDPADATYLGNDSTYDWQNAVINHSSSIRNYNIRASGASDNTNYSFSFGYASNDGPFIGYNSNRYSIATNIVTRMGKYLEVGINLRGVQQSTKNAPESITDANMDIWRAPPWQKMFDPSGPYGIDPLWKLNAPITPQQFDITSVYAQQFVAYRNVFGLLATTENITGNQTGLGSAYLQVQPVKGLKIKGSIAAQMSVVSVKSWRAFDQWWFDENPINPYSNTVDPEPGTKPAIVGFTNGATNSLLKSINVEYSFKKGLNEIGIMLDASEQAYRWTGNGTSRSVLTDDPARRYFSATGNENGFYELRAAYALIGYMARINYNYDGKYYAEAVVRRDGSSRFAPGHKWGTFPSATIGWRLSAEPFMTKFHQLNDLKIRGGFGVLGNEQTTGGWSYLSVSGVVRPSYNLGNPQVVNPGYSFSSFSNYDLTWEKLYSANIGIDAVLFDNRVSFTMDYYHKITKGIIQSVELSPSSGVSTPSDINVAEVLNKGIELQAGYNKIIGSVSTNFNFNFTTVHNKVLKLANHTALRSQGLEEGLPIGFIYGYKRAGIFRDQKEIDDWNEKFRDIISRRQEPGDLYFEDLYGAPLTGTNQHNPEKDGVINENDRTYLGKTIPGYFYGITATATYKSFDFSIFFQGLGDIQKFNEDRANGENMSGYGRNQLATVLNRWTENNRESEMPRAVYNDPNGNNRMSNRFVENAGYLRLKNIQVGYSFPAKLIERANVIRSLRIYVTGINIFTLTKYTGLDPEDDAYPNTRQFLAGIKVSF
ncbi:MAG: TonB-dependent receptor [Chitinophagaceae bacterium]|nr:TonB-dependent receptor [Chitinophagaceae bacterium]